MTVKIRYKTDAKPEDTLHWRVMIDGVEHSASNVIIHFLTYTTKYFIEGVGEKWYMTCEPKLVNWVGEECIII